MRYTIIVLLGFLPWICWAEEIQVTSNTPSGIYSQALEVSLNSNASDAHIVYYTDGYGRMDQLLEYHKNEPIVITKDTTLDFFAVLEGNSTKVQEVVLDMRYQNHFYLSSTSNEIILKNTSKETQNIGFWSIKGGDFEKTFPKNTFIEANASLKFPISNQQTFTLSSPDGSIKIQSKNDSIQAKSEKSFSPEVSVNTNYEKKGAENIEYLDFLPSEEENIEYIDFSPSQNDPTPVFVRDDDTFAHSIKTSILESSDQKHSNNLLWILFFMILVTGVGIFEIMGVITEKQFQKKLPLKERLKKSFGNTNLSNFGK